ncbi:hypothetical protein SISNIDRAFT_419656 [Sistotremastrum niveocremeum HHB9708]|uniref:CBM1 domain-containing protein n=1 Tax=Sistotremastrum niveocremeum HHB9708 TaxID=1314777 RepID=A0A164N6H3_9AGAM|nr:hypothetical protein SISNIDRAFT_419656 [Sistotremastrum niveocremeum HHB9708]
MLTPSLRHSPCYKTLTSTIGSTLKPCSTTLDCTPTTVPITSLYSVTTACPTFTTAPPSYTITTIPPTQTPYGQCGGIGWTGYSVCANPYSCVDIDPYYSEVCQVI